MPKFLSFLCFLDKSWIASKVSWNYSIVKLGIECELYRYSELSSVNSYRNSIKGRCNLNTKQGTPSFYIHRDSSGPPRTPEFEFGRDPNIFLMTSVGKETEGKSNLSCISLLLSVNGNSYRTVIGTLASFYCYSMLSFYTFSLQHNLPICLKAASDPKRQNLTHTFSKFSKPAATPKADSKTSKKPSVSKSIRLTRKHRNELKSSFPSTLHNYTKLLLGYE